MPDSAKTPYRVVLVGTIGDKARTLIAQADAAGIGQTARERLSTIVEQLQDQPLAFGEARYNLRALHFRFALACATFFPSVMRSMKPGALFTCSTLHL